MKRKIFLRAFIIFILLFLFIVEKCPSQWMHTNGIYTNLVSAILVNGNNIFAGANGVSLSTNNGLNWTTVNNGLTNLNVYTLAISGINIFAGTAGGVFLSTNNGNNWTQTALSTVTVTSIAVNGSYIFAGTHESGVFLSTNNGISWTQTALNNQYILSLVINGSYIFAGTNTNGIHRSSNNGGSWEIVGFNSSGANSLVANGNNIIAGIYNGVYISTNNGNSWTQTALNNQNVKTLAVSGSYIFAGTYSDGVFLSTNNGLSWSQTALSLDYIVCLAINGINVFAGTSLNGLYRTTNNGNNWTQIGILEGTVLSLSSSGSNLFAGTKYNGIYISTNNGISWNQTQCNNLTIYSIFVNGSNIFAGTDSGAYQSTNDGVNWIKTTLINRKVSSFAINGNNLFAGIGVFSSPFVSYGVYLSTNNGLGWTQTALNSHNVMALLVNENNIFAGVSNYISDYQGIYISTNNGVSWTQTALNSASINSLGAYQNNIFAGAYNQGLFKSINNGLNWTHTNLNQYVASLIVIGSNVFVGTDNGVYLSPNKGERWVNVNQGFNNSGIVKTLMLVNNFIFAGIEENSVWRRNINDFLPLSVNLLSPENNSVGKSINLDLKWRISDYASEYNLVLATDINFTNVIFNDTTLTDSIKSISNLNPLTNYFWKVRAKSIAGWGAFSSIFTFKTIGNPTQVVLSYPENNANNTPKNLTLKWFKAFDQTLYTTTPNQLNKNDVFDPNVVNKYWLEISSNETFSNILIRDSTIVDTIKSIYNVLIDTTNYWWRVKAKNEVGWSVFSSVFKFTTGTTGIQIISTEIPSKYSLNQNYPNPFNPTTKINIAIPKVSYVKITVYNISGKEMEILIDEKLQAGTYLLEWNAIKYSSGIYFYRLTALDFTETKRMILIK